MFVPHFSIARPKGFILKVAAKFRVIPATWVFAPFRGSAQNCAQSHNLKVIGSNPIPATK
jgi:hypothetical protein